MRKITSSEWMRDVERMAEQEHDPRNYIGVEVIISYAKYLLDRLSTRESGLERAL